MLRSERDITRFRESYDHDSRNLVLVIRAAARCSNGLNVGLVYGLFAFFAFVSFFFVLKFVKETKGVALEDMEG